MNAAMCRHGDHAEAKPRPCTPRSLLTSETYYEAESKVRPILMMICRAAHGFLFKDTLVGCSDSKVRCQSYTTFYFEMTDRHGTPPPGRPDHQKLGYRRLEERLLTMRATRIISELHHPRRQRRTSQSGRVERLWSVFTFLAVARAGTTIW